MCVQYMRACTVWTSRECLASSSRMSVADRYSSRCQESQRADNVLKFSSSVVSAVTSRSQGCQYQNIAPSYWYQAVYFKKSQAAEYERPCAFVWPRLYQAAVCQHGSDSSQSGRYLLSSAPGTDRRRDAVSNLDMKLRMLCSTYQFSIKTQLEVLYKSKGQNLM